MEGGECTGYGTGAVATTNANSHNMLPAGYAATGAAGNLLVCVNVVSGGFLRGHWRSVGPMVGLPVPTASQLSTSFACDVTRYGEIRLVMSATPSLYACSPSLGWKAVGVDESGNLTIGGSISAANATFSGNVSAGSLVVSGNAAVGSLTVGGGATFAGVLLPISTRGLACTTGQIARTSTGTPLFCQGGVFKYLNNSSIQYYWLPYMTWQPQATFNGKRVNPANCGEALSSTEWPAVKRADNITDVQADRATGATNQTMRWSLCQNTTGRRMLEIWVTWTGNTAQFPVCPPATTLEAYLYKNDDTNSQQGALCSYSVDS